MNYIYFGLNRNNTFFAGFDISKDLLLNNIDNIDGAIDVIKALLF